MTEKALIGSLVGTAIGEALGLPYAGMTKADVKNAFRPVGAHHMLMGKGLSSGNTDQAIMSYQALTSSGSNSTLFKDEIATRIRIWILSLPYNVSPGTMRTAIKLLLGGSTSKSGTYSAGTAPATRAAPVGIIYSNDSVAFCRFIRECTYLTHTDPRSLYGTIAIALATIFSYKESQIDIEDYIDKFNDLTEGFDTFEIVNLIRKAHSSYIAGESTSDFSSSIGLKSMSTSYIYHTVPLVVHAWFSHPEDFKQGIISLIECGGDTSSMTALYGSIVGARLGVDKIPRELIKNYADRAKSIDELKAIGSKLAKVRKAQGRGDAEKVKPLPLFVGNLKLWSIVLVRAALYKVGFLKATYFAAVNKSAASLPGGSKKQDEVDKKAKSKQEKLAAKVENKKTKGRSPSAPAPSPVLSAEGSTEEAVDPKPVKQSKRKPKKDVTNVPAIRAPAEKEELVDDKKKPAQSTGVVNKVSSLLSFSKSIPNENIEVRSGSNARRR